MRADDIRPYGCNQNRAVEATISKKPCHSERSRGIPPMNGVPNRGYTRLATLARYDKEPANDGNLQTVERGLPLRSGECAACWTFCQCLSF